jgi:hypothetical protein
VDADLDAAFMVGFVILLWLGALAVTLIAWFLTGDG